MTFGRMTSASASGRARVGRQSPLVAFDPLGPSAVRRTFPTIRLVTTTTHEDAAGDPAPADEQLRAYRASIDNIDAALVHLLAERFKITQAVGRYKAAVGLPPSDPERERAQIDRLRNLAVESGLDPSFSEKFLRFIVEEVIRHHRRIADER